MFELGKTRRRVEVLEREAIPKMMGEVDEINRNIHKISSQLSKLIVLVAASGVLGSPDVVRGLVSGAYHLSEPLSGYEVKSIVREEMKKSNEKGDIRKWQ
jgi:hypothetical protein